MMRRPLFTQPGTQEPPERPPAAVAPGAWWPQMRPVYQPPVVTYSLIAVNVAMWMAVAAVEPGNWLRQLWMPSPISLLLLGGKLGPAIQAGEYWRLVTATFLHAGVIHLAVNMWALLQLGTLCEVLYGRARFTILYVCSGVIGTLASYKLWPELGVGASGAIFGLLGAALVYSMKYRQELPRGMADQMRRSLMPALLLNLLITFSLPIIDRFAHLGGLIAGGALAALTESPHAPAERRAREALPVPAALLTAVGLLFYGTWGLASVAPVVRAFHQEGHLLQQRRWWQATRNFLTLSHSKMAPWTIQQIGMALADDLSRAHRGEEAEAVYRRLLQLHPGDPELLNGLAYFYADVLETNLDEAERMSHKALEADSNNEAFLDTLAWIYFKQGKVAEAYATQQRVMQLGANLAEERYHMGAIQEARGDLAAARQEYERAVKLDPTFAPARKALEKLRQRIPAPQSPSPPPRREVAGMVDS